MSLAGEEKEREGACGYSCHAVVINLLVVGQQDNYIPIILLDCVEISIIFVYKIFFHGKCRKSKSAFLDSAKNY